MRCMRQCLRNPIQQHLRASHFQASSACRSVPVLEDGQLLTFQTRAFRPQTPALLPQNTYSRLPAIRQWFTQHPVPALDTAYLRTYADAIVPLEITADDQFSQVHERLAFFLDAASQPLTARIYLAQASLSDLPAGLCADVPTPEIVLRAGKGDVYDTSIWLGAAPTYTPLHRDPNPNLFVQLAGRKRVRLFGPDVGGAIFAHVQQRIGGAGSATMRGVEMMQGEERRMLEGVVWGSEDEDVGWQAEGYECEVGAGNGLFIPKGWWHSIKGVGEGMTGSVRWTAGLA